MAVMIPIVLCYELGGKEFAATFEVINMRRCSGKADSCKLRCINIIRSTPKGHRHQGLSICMSRNRQISHLPPLGNKEIGKMLAFVWVFCQFLYFPLSSISKAKQIHVLNN